MSWGWSLELVLQLWPNKKGTQAPVTAFWSSSISNAVGPACGIVALKYISYPAQVCSAFGLSLWMIFQTHCLNLEFGWLCASTRWHFSFLLFLPSLYVGWRWWDHYLVFASSNEHSNPVFQQQIFSEVTIWVQWSEKSKQQLSRKLSKLIEFILTTFCIHFINIVDRMIGREVITTEN